jgi:ferritin-like metal-binding protein YciE
MAQYGSRRTCAEFLGKKVGRALLQETLDEECVTERNRQEALAISDPDGKF